ncbi:MAG: hypothetical protein M1827_006557 [Pycnora praestabilis]|nr:MAG: hypothetical protein M1827_006557 [Pycnora praestabilis]
MGILQRIRGRQTEGSDASTSAPAAFSVDQNSRGTDTSTTTAATLSADGKPLTGDVKIIGPNAPVPISSVLDEKSVIETSPPSTEHGILVNKEAVGTPGDDADIEKAEEDEEDLKVYPGGWTLGILTLGLCLALFVVALDNTIIATAIPRITTQFNSLNDVGWYGSSYLLTTTSLQPSFGKIYTYFDVKWTFLSALIIFELGSIVCAAAKNSVMLIVGRAIAGAGAAALFSGGMTIIAFSVPLKKRPIYIALLSSMFGISSVVGPILGGALTDKATWRWCFWINLPFGGVALLTVFFFFKNPIRKHNDLTTGQKIKKIDLLGAFFLICGIVCLLLALQWGGSTYPWRDSKVYGCLIGFGIIITMFIFLQFKLGENATIPPRILKQRTVLASSWFSCFLAMGLYTHVYYLPFYFQAVKGTTAEGSGIRTIPYLVSITLASIVIGGSITVIGIYTPFMWFGAVVFTIGAAMLSTLKAGSNAGQWIGYQILTGVGAGAGVQIPFIAVQAVLSEKDMPTGNAIAIFFNSLGGAVSISIAQNIFSNTLIQEIPKRAPGLNPATIISAGATHVKDVTPKDQLQGVLEAYSYAIDRSFILAIAVGAIALIFSLFVEWKSIKGKKMMAAGGA